MIFNQTSLQEISTYLNVIYYNHIGYKDYFHTISNKNWNQIEWNQIWTFYSLCCLETKDFMDL